MRIAIIGYGKMGHEIEAQAQWMKIPVSRVLTRNDQISQIHFNSDEIAIEFTSPESCLTNVDLLLEKNVPVVCGTTGWWQQLPEIRMLVEKNNGAFLYASNFSIGVHLFWQTLNSLASKINHVDQYKVRLSEKHHSHKKDYPSGTAKTCENILKTNIPRLKCLDMESIREGEVIGDHHVFFDSAEDRITLSHQAKNRSGFARGAIECAKWLENKKGFFSIDDFMKERLS